MLAEVGAMTPTEIDAHLASLTHADVIEMIRIILDAGAPFASRDDLFRAFELVVGTPPCMRVAE